MTSKESTPPSAPASDAAVDAGVLEGCRAGRPVAQRRLYELCNRRVFRLMVRMVGLQDAADVTQQVFLQVFHKIAQFGGQAKFGTWLYRLAVNEALQHLRRAKRWRFQALSHEPTNHRSADGDGHEQKELLAQALGRLEPELRAIFVLREVDELSYREIAEVVGVPEGTVGSRLNRRGADCSRPLSTSVGSRDMNCPQVRELLSAYFDGELADDLRLHLSTHLDECPDCRSELAGFKSLSTMADGLSDPPPPAGVWSEIERQLDRPVPAKSVDTPWYRSSRAVWLATLAATVLLAGGIGWYALRTQLGHGEQSHATADFADYLNEFQRDPHAAQQMLLANYDGQAMDPAQVIHEVGFRPVVAEGLPEEYAIQSTNVVKMPCCTCVQTVCRRSDGSTLAIFEHDDDHSKWFDNRPGITANCCGTQCCLIELDDHLAASWKRGQRNITLIGVQDVSEVNKLVAWMDTKPQPVP